MEFTCVSADSHITEPPGTYIDHIDPAFRDRAPRMVHHDALGDVFLVDGFDKPLPMGLVAGAGTKPEDIRVTGIRFEDLHRGGWDPDARMSDQDLDGVGAEVIYPTVGMLLCNHPDVDYKKACFDAYNRWLAGFCSAQPTRLFGIGQTALRTVAEGIEDLRKIKELGFKGVMLPGEPPIEDYDSTVYDPFWEAAVDLDLPISFHILTTSGSGNFMTDKVRGPRLNSFVNIIRDNQDIIGMFVFSGVFERFPGLRLVCVEADAGWAPHYMYRMDHAYDRHRHWMSPGTISRPPSEYFRENVYMTFQDDWVAFQVLDLCNPKRMLWANDFPHTDSTWPHSPKIIADQTKHLDAATKRDVLRDNVCELYDIDVPETSV